MTNVRTVSTQHAHTHLCSDKDQLLVKAVSSSFAQCIFCVSKIANFVVVNNNIDKL